MAFLDPGSFSFRLWRIGLAVGLTYVVVGFLTSRTSLDPVAGRVSNARVIPGASDAESGDRYPFVATGVLSVHSGRSHDSNGTLEEVAEAARAEGLDFVVLGDHPRDWIDEPGVWDPRVIDGVRMVMGSELLVAHVGRTLTFGLDSMPRLWESGLADLGATADADGAFVQIVHARSPRWGESWKDPTVDGAQGFESFDISEMARARLASVWGPYHLISFVTGTVAGRSDESMVRLWRERSETPALNAYDSLRARGPLALTGGLNHHAKLRTPLGLLPGFRPAFRTVVNHVHLDAPLPDDAVAAQQVLAEALRHGRLYVSLGWPEQAHGFRVRVMGPAPIGAPVPGAEVTTDSSEVPAAPLPAVLDAGDVGSWTGADRIVVDLPAAPVQPLLVRLLRDGDEVDWVQADAGDRVEWPIEAPGVFRVEVFRAGLDLGVLRLGLTPWLFSNPIEIRPR